MARQSVRHCKSGIEIDQKNSRWLNFARARRRQH
jgi:hypothetical protein